MDSQSLHPQVSNYMYLKRKDTDPGAGEMFLTPPQV